MLLPAQGWSRAPCLPTRPDRCVAALPTRARGPHRPINQRANLSPSAGLLRGVMNGPGLADCCEITQQADKPLNLTHRVLKGEMSVFITYLSYNKYLKCALTSSLRTIGLCGPGLRGFN